VPLNVADECEEAVRGPLPSQPAPASYFRLPTRGPQGGDSASGTGWATLRSRSGLGAVRYLRLDKSP